MKILYYFRELNTPMYWWQRIHFFDELKRNKIAEILSFNPLDFSTIEQANEKLLLTIKRQRDIDVFLTCVDAQWIYPSTIQIIKSFGIPTILVCWDNLELPFKHKKIAHLFDVVWITSRETTYLFEKWGCKKVIFQTYGANPYKYTPNWHKPNYTVGFIGSPYGSRINKINDLVGNDICCSVYSNALFDKKYNTSTNGKQLRLGDTIIKSTRYLRFSIGRKVLFSTIINKLRTNISLITSNIYLKKFPSVSDLEMNSLYSNFALSLNITELRDTYILTTPIHKIHLRTFEIPMCGGLQLASRTDELQNYFLEDKEIVLYSSQEEMVDKCKFYLSQKNESTVKSMKLAARRRAEQDHTWSRRFNKVLNEL